MTHNPTREEAWTILTDHVKSPGPLSHALAVETVMRLVAGKKGASLMEVPLEELIADAIEGMKTVAEAIGLKGNPGGSPSA